MQTRFDFVFFAPVIPTAIYVIGNVYVAFDAIPIPVTVDIVGPAATLFETGDVEQKVIVARATRFADGRRLGSTQAFIIAVYAAVMVVLTTVLHSTALSFPQSSLDCVLTDIAMSGIRIYAFSFETFCVNLANEGHMRGLPQYGDLVPMQRR